MLGSKKTSDSAKNVEARLHLLPYSHPCLAEVRLALEQLRNTRFPRFIGNHPEDLTRDKLSNLELDKFVFTEKKDGLRVLLITVKRRLDGEVFCVLNDRKNNCVLIEGLSKNCQNFSPSQMSIFEATLPSWQPDRYSIDVIDCELCVDCGLSPSLQESAFSLSLLLNASKSQEANILLENCTLHAFDILMLHSQAYTQMPFKQRHETMIAQDVAIGSISVMFGLRFQVKDMFSISEILGNEITARAETWEGLIFYHKDKSYFTMHKNSLLRWKPASKLSVDLLVVREEGTKNVRLLAWTGRANYSEISVLPLSEVPELSDREPAQVAEFSLQITQSLTWKFIRWRPDRMKANHVSRVKSTMHEAKYGLRNLSELILEAGRTLQIADFS